MPPFTLIALYCVLIVLASLAGGWLPTLWRVTHARMQLMMSAVAGLMLGVALLQLLPHSFEKTGSLPQTALWILIGLLSMFFLIRVFDFHHHDTEHGEPHDHTSPEQHSSHQHASGHPSQMSWMGVAFGLALHTLIDGLILATAVEAAAYDTVDPEASGLLPLGMGSFLAIVLHKPLDAMSITSLMEASGWSVAWRQCINVGFSLMCPLGAALFSVSIDQFSQHNNTVLGCALGFAAGVFLCISLGDLLPELQFHAHDRLKLSLALLLGVGTAYGIGALEPQHEHAAPSQNEKPSETDNTR